MLRLRNLHEIKQFVTTSDSITAVFNDLYVLERAKRVHGGAYVAPYSIRFTMKEFDNLF